MVVATFTMMPVVETTIEEKHSRATMEAKGHAVGLVRLSLSNRLPLLERNLTRQPEQLRPLLDCLDVTRKFGEAVILFGLGDHPLFCGDKDQLKSWQLAKLLALVLYHADIDAESRSLQKHIRTHNKGIVAAAAAAAATATDTDTTSN